MVNPDQADPTDLLTDILRDLAELLQHNAETIHDCAAKLRELAHALEGNRVN